MHGEFDQYIDGYRPNLDKSLSLSGENSTYFAHYKAQKLATWLAQLRNQPISILDFGCGDGLMTQFVQDYFAAAHVYGVDPSAKSIEVAQQTYPHLTFKVNSDEHTQLDFSDETFDIVYAAGAFHHIPFALHKGYMQELHRIVKKSGYIIIFELNPLNPLTVYTFKHNPIDQHATMLKPWYCYNLSKSYGKTHLKFYCFFPKFFSWLRCTEPYISKIPFGALYAMIIQKNK